MFVDSDAKFPFGLRSAGMIITCPNCHTKYQVADKSIGSAGRKVVCAHCHESWLATADLPAPVVREVPAVDQLFGEEDEKALDAAFEAEARAADAMMPAPTGSGDDGDDAREVDAAEEAYEEPPALDAREQQSRLLALYRRQKRLVRRSPLARMRRAARALSLLSLAAILGLGIGLRDEIVSVFPELGGAYQAIGLGVNVMGLSFTKVETLRTMRDGVDVMMISATIENVSNRSRRVPPVLVSILDAHGKPLYQWKARAQADTVGIGGAVGFKTQLNSAPVAAKKVRLTFAEGGDASNPARVIGLQQGSK